MKRTNKDIILEADITRPSAHKPKPSMCGPGFFPSRGPKLANVGDWVFAKCDDNILRTGCVCLISYIGNERQYRVKLKSGDIVKVKEIVRTNDGD